MKKSIFSFCLIIIFIIAIALVPACSQKKPAVMKPSFTIDTPEGWTHGNPRPDDPREVLNVYTGIYKVPALTANRIEPAEVTSPEDAAKHVCESMKEYFESESCEVIYTKNITLEDGSPAFETQIKWKHPFALFYTAQVMTKKGNLAYTAAVHDLKPLSNELLKYIHSFRIANK